VACEQVEQCTPYLLRLLSTDEVARYEEHLASSLDDCMAELVRISKTVESLASVGSTSVSRLKVNERILSRIRCSAEPEVQVWKTWETSGIPRHFLSVRADEGVWEGVGIEGISVKRLFADAERQRVTMLVRMAAGTISPGHRHAGLKSAMC